MRCKLHIVSEGAWASVCWKSGSTEPVPNDSACPAVLTVCRQTLTRLCMLIAVTSLVGWGYRQQREERQSAQHQHPRPLKHVGKPIGRHDTAQLESLLIP